MLIGICGAAGCGKNTVADILCHRHGFMQIAFADPIYRAVAAITGVPAETLKDRGVKETPLPGVGVSPRHLLQTLGTEWGRNMIDDEIWIKRAMRDVERLRACTKSDAKIVITDVRFDNEARAVRKQGGVIWEVVRNAPSCLAAGAARHESEAGVNWELVSRVVFNEGSIDDLKAAVDAAMQEATKSYN